MSEDIIDKTIEKSKEMDRARLLTERAAADYNRDIENINEDRGGQNDLYRRDDRSRSRDGRVFTDGSDRGNSDEDRRENLGYESKYQILMQWTLAYLKKGRGIYVSNTYLRR